MRDALVRHMQFYNTCPQFEAIVVGIVAALEVKNAESGNTMGPTIEAVKTSLMGPTGVIGDAFFQTGGFRRQYWGFYVYRRQSIWSASLFPDL